MDIIKRLTIAAKARYGTLVLPEGDDPRIVAAARRLDDEGIARVVVLDAAAMAEYMRCFAKPEVIHATCEDYRAGATIDMELDLADRKAGRRITCPLLFLWAGSRGFGGVNADPLDIWRNWADDVSGGPLPSGHFLPEEAPDELVARLMPFLSANAQ